jgi:hypothetical protein
MMIPQLGRALLALLLVPEAPRRHRHRMTVETQVEEVLRLCRSMGSAEARDGLGPPFVRPEVLALLAVRTIHSVLKVLLW